VGTAKFTKYALRKYYDINKFITTVDKITL